jgi:hypothetical protein
MSERRVHLFLTYTSYFCKQSFKQMRRPPAGITGARCDLPGSLQAFLHRVTEHMYSTVFADVSPTALLVQSKRAYMYVLLYFSLLDPLVPLCSTYILYICTLWLFTSARLVSCMPEHTHVWVHHYTSRNTCIRPLSFSPSMYTVHTIPVQTYVWILFSSSCSMYCTEHTHVFSRPSSSCTVYSIPFVHIHVSS